MAKATAQRKKGTIRRQGRRVMPALRRTAKRVKSLAERGPLTLGEIIAAAYDTSGGEFRDVLAQLTSPQMSKALGRRIELVG
jgi:hypothetical protein